MEKIDGTIMSGDNPVILVKDDKLEIINEDLMPLFFKRNHSVEKWIANRAIDNSRVNSRLLKKIMKMEEKDDITTVLLVNAVTITDNFWFRRKGEENLTWEDVKFKSNIFSSVALYGDIDGFSIKPSRNPELTNIGSFEKCWKLENGKWYLYKTGKVNEIFSEMFIYLLGEKLGFNVAKYEIDGKYIRSLDFTNGNEVNFESAYSLVGDNDNYEKNFETFLKIDKNIAKDYLRLIYLDTVCLNVDRHTQNYGVLRDKKSGKILGLAPNFDNNIALISRGYPKDIERTSDVFIEFFTEFIKSNKTALAMFEELNIPEITVSMIRECFSKINKEILDDIDLEFVEKYILAGKEIINKFIWKEKNK